MIIGAVWMYWVLCCIYSISSTVILCFMFFIARSVNAEAQSLGNYQTFQTSEI